MKNCIKFDECISKLKVQPEVELEVMQSEDKDYIVLESESLEDLKIEHSENELSVHHKNQPSIGELVDAFSDFLINKKTDELQKLETPSLKLKLCFFTNSKNLSIKINNGIVSINKELDYLELKANNLTDFHSINIDKLLLKANYGEVSLVYPENLISWNIKLNKGNLTIKQNGITYSYKAKVNNNKQCIGKDVKVDVVINHGDLNFV